MWPHGPPARSYDLGVLSSATAVIGIDGLSMFLREPLLGSSLPGMFLREPLPLFTVPRDVCATTGAIPPLPDTYVCHGPGANPPQHLFSTKRSA